MRLSRKKLQQIIEQEVKHDLAAEHPADIEPTEDAYAGGDNLVLDLDFSSQLDLGNAEIPAGPEVLSSVDGSGVGVSQVSEARLRLIIRNILLASQKK
jgi:hypothetical protein